jgi:hypothetical protein
MEDQSLKVKTKIEHKCNKKFIIKKEETLEKKDKSLK